MCAQYVTHGAKIKCTCGSKIAELQVLPDRTVTLTAGHYANIADHQSMVNIPPFGVCRSLKYPPTKSATDAHHGSLTPMPCKPGTMFIWEEGNDSYIIRRYPALLTSSYCKCIYGGVITIVTDGQIPANHEFTKESSLLTEDVNSETDDGFGLDVVDFIPVVGSIRDIGAGIAAGSAGLVALGAVFLVADVAGLVGSAFSGGAASVGVTAAKSTVKAGIKTAAKASGKADVKSSADVAANQGEKYLLKYMNQKATGGASKLPVKGNKELEEMTVKETGNNPFKVNTEVAETGAEEAKKSSKAVQEIVEKSKELQEAGKEILDAGMKQIDKIAKIGRESFEHFGNQLKKDFSNEGLDKFFQDLEEANKLPRELKRFEDMKRFLK